MAGMSADRCRSTAQADYWNPTGDRTFLGSLVDLLRAAVDGDREAASARQGLVAAIAVLPGDHPLRGVAVGAGGGPAGRPLPARRAHRRRQGSGRNRRGADPGRVGRRRRRVGPVPAMAEHRDFMPHDEQLDVRIAYP